VSPLFWLAFALLPLLLLATTSFVKLSIVFSVLRNALGAGDVPSGTVVAVLSIILSGFVMLPVARDVVSAVAPLVSRIDPAAPASGDSKSALTLALERGAEPWRLFLDRNAGASERTLFIDLLRKALPESERASVTGAELGVVVPAFFVTELAEAFQIAFLVLLPFLVVDLVIASVLTALGMQAVSPAVVALPFKLLLFVSADGFRALIEALVAGYR
jgi:type III secretion protein R